MIESPNRPMPGFWSLQAGFWILLYLLCLTAAGTHLRESFVVAYNTWAIFLLFAASLVLRYALRYVNDRWNTSWLRVQSLALALCFIGGTFATLLTALFTFGLRGFRLSYWTLSGVNCTIALFLWATLYYNSKHWHSIGEARSAVLPVLTVEANASASETVWATKFTVRVGTRIEVVAVDQVLWIAAARDYVELHTKSSVHLLRETLSSVDKRLDPTRFLRIHRSRIIRIDQMLQLIALDNGEYRIKLRDGSEHRSSRTYSAPISQWIQLGNP